MRALRHLSLVPLALTLGCSSFAVPDSETVPDTPTWENSVQQVFANHCVVCHGEHPNRGAPDYFRLDVYESTGDRTGAADMAAAAYYQVAGGAMPPGIGAQLGPNDTEILKRWMENGAPKGDGAPESNGPGSPARPSSRGP